MTKYLIIALAVLLVLMVLIFFFFRRPSETPAPISSTTPSPRASVAGEPIYVGSVSPKNNSLNVGLSAEILITFNRSLREEEKESIFFSSNPPIEGYTRFVDNNQSLLISPEASLIPNQNYELKVMWGNEVYEWSFTTTINTTLSEAEQIDLQRKADENYGLWSSQVTNDYPWLNKLPLKDSRYFVYFDIEKKAFFGVLYVEESNQTVVRSLKNEIEQLLQRQEIPYQNFTFNWEFD